MNILELQAQLNELNKVIAAKKLEVQTFKKLQNCKLTQKTAHKYYSLQELYMNTIKGQ
jgi:hypothetical protein